MAARAMRLRTCADVIQPCLYCLVHQSEISSGQLYCGSDVENCKFCRACGKGKRNVVHIMLYIVDDQRDPGQLFK